MAAVIVNWNCWPDTVGAVNSVRCSEYPNLEIVVVENGSQVPPDWEQVKSLGNVTCLSTGANLGFAGGANAGIPWALAKGVDLVWLVNPDTRVEKNTLSVLVESLSADSKIGIIGPTLRYLDHKRLIKNLGLRVFPQHGCKVVAVGNGKEDSILYQLPWRRAPQRSMKTEQ